MPSRTLSQQTGRSSHMVSTHAVSGGWISLIDAVKPGLSQGGSECERFG